jgi:hypothetical protein
MSDALVTAKTVIAPGEVVRRQALKFTMNHYGHIVSETMGSFPQGYDFTFK